MKSLYRPCSRSSDLLFMTAVALSPDSFDRVKKSINIDELDDVHAKNIFTALGKASSGNKMNTESILSLLDDYDASIFICAVVASGELRNDIDKVIDDGIKAIQKRTIERNIISTMPNIETPEDEEILQFLNNLADYCIPMDGGKMRMTSQVWPIVKARDAVIRAKSATLLKTCGEALEEAREHLPDLISAPNKIEPSAIRAARKVFAALAALKEEGVME